MKYKMKHNYSDGSGRITIRKDKVFEIKSIWGSCVETTAGLISLKAFELFAIEVDDEENETTE